MHVFEPAPRIFGWRPNVLRRMHRKIVVVDAQLAFVGGINYSADHLGDFGPGAKQDWSVACAARWWRTSTAFATRRWPQAMAGGGQLGPFGIRQWFRDHAPLRRRPDALPAAGDAQALFVTRDNHNHPSDIEHHYLQAVRGATQRVVIANAYFFPGYRFIRELRRAARRGVDVCLILQGEPDMPIVKTAASLLYHHLTKAGVRIYEYCERPLHGKVARGGRRLVHGGLQQPGSLEPGAEPGGQRHHPRQKLIAEHCRRIPHERPAPVWAFWRPLRSFLLFHLLSGYSRWLGWLPHRAPKIRDAAPEPAPAPAAAASCSGGPGHGAH
jgi:cardiolipin synthase